MRPAVLCSWILALALPSPAFAQGGGSAIQIKGSDTIGERLGQDLARAYMAQHPEQQIRWESLGSSTAFVGLFDGSADLGASSRPVKPAELEQARAEGVELREYVMAYDGTAVIVHPSNPLTQISVEELSEVFAGRLSSWEALGGANRPIELLSRPSYSGTHVFFKEVVLRRGDPTSREEFAPSTEFIEETSRIVERVARDPDAISYVGLGFVGDRPVKVLRVSLAGDDPSIDPTPEHVRDGSYPIYRPLYLYSRGEPQGGVRAFLAFVLSAEGQRRVAAQGFVPRDAPAELPQIAAVSARPPAASPPRDLAPTRILFAFASAELDADALARIEQLVARGITEGERFQIVGHADARGSAEANRSMARARAQAVARQLRAAGVPAELIEIAAQGSDEPLATNDSAEGRRKNRRVDVRIVGAPEPASSESPTAGR